MLVPLGVMVTDESADVRFKAGPVRLLRLVNPELPPPTPQLQTLGLANVQVKYVCVPSGGGVAGNWRLDLDAEQAQRLHMKLKKPVTFTVSPDGGYLADIKAEVVFDRSAEQ